MSALAFLVKVPNMPQIMELLELADQCSELANLTPNPEAKKALLDMGGKYVHQADQLRSHARDRSGLETRIP